MFNRVKQCSIDIDGIGMNYVVFGKGERSLVMLPGLGDGLRPIKGWFQAAALANAEKLYAKYFKVYIFSRKDVLASDYAMTDIAHAYTTRDMAHDQKLALDALGIKKCLLMGISQGGMIAEHFAIDYPEVVERLVIGVSAARQNPTIHDTVSRWIRFAKVGDYKELMIDTSEKTYSEKTLRKYRKMYPILTRVGKPKSFERFLIQANSCLTHNAYERLSKIQCPTLIIGGDCDNVLDGSSSVEMAEKISGSRLVMLEGYGHGAFEESREFNEQAVRFLHEDR